MRVGQKHFNELMVDEKGQGCHLIGQALQCDQIYFKNHESYESLGVVTL